MEIQQSSSNPIPIMTLESSMENLLGSWNRRARWRLFFHCYTQRREEDDRMRASWRTQLANLLESTAAHLLALSLLLLDLILTVLDLSASLLSCSPSKKIKIDGDVFYHWAGIAILTMLSMKSVVLVVALGRSFFGQPGRVVDGLVVIGALLLETLVRGEGGGLLVVVSLWRVVRVVESTFELSDEAIEAQIDEIVFQFGVLKDENQQLQKDIVEKDEMIAELEEALSPYRNQFLHDHNDLGMETPG